MDHDPWQRRDCAQPIAGSNCRSMFSFKVDYYVVVCNINTFWSFSSSNTVIVICFVHCRKGNCCWKLLFHAISTEIEGMINASVATSFPFTVFEQSWIEFKLDWSPVGPDTDGPWYRLVTKTRPCSWSDCQVSITDSHCDNWSMLFFAEFLTIAERCWSKKTDLLSFYLCCRPECNIESASAGRRMFPGICEQE